MSRNIHELLEKQSKKFNNKIFMINSIDESTVTYKQLNEGSNKVSNILKKYGAKKGDRVGIYLTNINEWILCFFGPLKIGAVSVLFDYNSKEENIIYILNKNKIKFLFVEEQFIDVIKKIKRKIRSLKYIFCISSIEHKIFDILNFKKEFESAKRELQLKNDVKFGDEAMVVYTSGSTGFPKGIIQDQKYIVKGIDFEATWFNFKENESFLCIQPLFYVDFLVYLGIPLARGGHFVLTKKFSKSKFWYYIDKYRINYANLNPAVIKILLNPPEDISRYRTNSLKAFLSSGALLPKATILEFEKYFKVPVFDAYGITEVGWVAMNPINVQKRKLGSVGKVLPHVQVEILDSEGIELPKNKKGEIVVKSPFLMKGYIDLPGETKKPIEDNFYHTKDIGFLDNDGFLYINGRISYFINRGGEKISPEEINAVLQKHPKIKESVTFGIQDEILGEEVRSVVVLEKEAKINEEKIINFCQKWLPKSRCPKSILFLDKIPLSSSGKYDTKKLKEL